MKTNNGLGNTIGQQQRQQGAAEIQNGCDAVLFRCQRDGVERQKQY